MCRSHKNNSVISHIISHIHLLPFPSFQFQFSAPSSSSFSLIPIPIFCNYCFHIHKQISIDNTSQDLQKIKCSRPLNKQSNSMDILFAQIQADLKSNDPLLQSGVLLQALQQFAVDRDIFVIAKSAVEEIVASPASAVSKKPAFDLIRSTRLTTDLWEIVCTGIHNDLEFLDPEVTAAAVSILAAIPSYRLGKLITDSNKEISSCFDSRSDNLRFSITETLGCILARDDLVILCENNINLLDKVSNWWNRIGMNMLDKADNDSTVAFESVGRLL